MSPVKRYGRLFFVKTFLTLRGYRSEQLDGKCRGLAAADAQRGDAASATAGLERMQQRHEQARAARADRMAERDRAAVDVELLVRYAEVVHRRHRDARERFVDFEQVHVLDAPPGLLQHLAQREHRRG